MHNLYLGTAKFMMKQVLNTSMFNADDVAIQEKLDKCIIPNFLGRIPYKIASSFSALTADQWKTWTNIFSLYALHGLIVDGELDCWRLFVRASQLLCKPMISIEDATKGHQALLDFCVCFETLYGFDKVTLNMHLHTHLLNCIKDYGPIYSFWLFI